MRTLFAKAAIAVLTAAVMLSGCSSNGGNSGDSKAIDSADIQDSSTDSMADVVAGGTVDLTSLPDIPEDAQPFDNITADNFYKLCILGRRYEGNSVLYGLANMTNGKEILPAEYDACEFINATDDKMLFWSNDKTAIVDFESHDIVYIDNGYGKQTWGDYILLFKVTETDGRTEWRYGIADMQGNVLLPAEHRKIFAYWPDGFYVSYGEGSGTRALYDKNGNKLIERECEDISRGSDCWLITYDDNDTQKTDVYDADLQYVKTMDGAIVGIYGAEGYYIKRDGKINAAVLNSSFEETLAKGENDLIVFGKDFIVCGDKIYDVDGKPLYDIVEERNGIYTVRNGGEWAAYSRMYGAKIFCGDYDEVYCGMNAIAALDADGWHIFDGRGRSELTKTPIPGELELAGSPDMTERYVPFRDEEMYLMYYSFEGERLFDESELPEEYDDYSYIRLQDDGILTLSGGFGEPSAVVNSDGEIIVKGDYFVTAVRGGFVICKTNDGVCEVYNYDGKLLAECYDCQPLGDGTAYLTFFDEDKSQYNKHINLNGEELEAIDTADTIMITEGYNEYGVALGQTVSGDMAVLVDKHGNVLCEYNLFDYISRLM